VESRRVRYLFLLVLTVLCAQVVEIFAFSGLSVSGLPEALSKARFDVAAVTNSIFWIFASSVGPFMVFPLAGMFVFREYSWSLWCLVLGASAYAALILLGLLGEYGMAHAAVEAAQRGQRYMNCGGHPRLFMMIFAVPLTAGTLFVSSAVLSVEAIVRSFLSDEDNGKRSR
jgi:hypothetical protein